MTNAKQRRQWLASSWAYSLYSSIVVTIIYATSHSASPSSQSNDGICDIIKVIDGDSLLVLCTKRTHRLRLMHIDAPEITQPIWGKSAQKLLRQLAGKKVFVAFHGKDIYQRDLAVIYAAQDEREPINLRLVKQGAARVYPRYKPPKNYIVAMQEAKKAQLGIWQTKGLHQDPMRYRRLTH